MELPTPTEYAHIREVAEMYLQKAEQQSDEELAVGLDFPSPDKGWAFRIHVYEKDVDPDERKHWHYQGTEHEMKDGLGALQ